MRPIKYKSPTRWRTVLLCIAGAWIIGLTAWFPAIVYFRKTSVHTPNDCYFMPSERIYTLVQSVLVYYVPITCMLCFYTLCLYGLNKRFSKFKSTTGPVNLRPRIAIVPDLNYRSASLDAIRLQVLAVGQASPANGKAEAYNDCPSPDVSSANDSFADVTPVTSPQQVISRAGKRRLDHVRGVRTLGVIMAMFLFCWVPFCVMWPLAAYCGSCIPERLYAYSYWSAYINSIVNPILYFCCNQQFRRASKTLLRRLCAFRNYWV